MPLQKNEKGDAQNPNYYRIIILIMLIIFLVITGWLLTREKEYDRSGFTEAAFADGSAEPLPTAVPTVMVHVKGAVINPGVYTVGGDLRIKDAVFCAGGFSENADVAAVNLAEFLCDGEEVIIPSVSVETTAPKLYEKTTKGNSESYSATYQKPVARININTATAEQLDSLPGIGKSLAERIIQYRTYVLFKTPSDIKNVSGIGDSLYDKIRDHICVK